MYDFTKATDLVKWAEEQYKNKNRYKSGGIGRYDSDGTRQFDCCGLFKCFMWHDYSTKNAKYYGKTQKDLSCEGLLAEAKEKGEISTIPEIAGVLVYMKGHMGIYIGNGQVIESTAAKYNGKNGKIYKTYFKGNGAGCDGKRTTWIKWFKSPYLTYGEEIKPAEPTKEETTKTDNFLGARGYIKLGDKSESVSKIAEFMYKTFPAYTSKKALGNYYGPNIANSIGEFQRRCKAQGIYDDAIDKCVGPKTLKCLRYFGFPY